MADWQLVQETAGSVAFRLLMHWQGLPWQSRSRVSGLQTHLQKKTSSNTRPARRITSPARPKFVSAQTGRVEECKELLAAGAHANSINHSYNESPLVAACRCRNSLAPVVACLLDNGADPNLCDKSGELPLKYASYYGHLSIVNRLLEAGAHVNEDDSEMQAII